VIACECRDLHESRRIVLTGCPGAGKTAVLEMIRQSFCEHVKVLPESAGIVFGGGFPRESNAAMRRAAQPAIFFVQRELEIASAGENAAILLCDRGTVDGIAYWPDGDDLWTSVGTTLAQQLQQYDAVIHLCTPSTADGYNHANPLRIESAAEASELDARIARAWERHPRRFVVEPLPDFLNKAARVLDILRSELPECCRHHVVPALAGR
jgi:predicted ATPase